MPRQVSTIETIPANEKIAAHLRLSTGDLIAVRRRVMYADEEPLHSVRLLAWGEPRKAFSEGIEFSAAGVIETARTSV